jgi:hypothetical protein
VEVNRDQAASGSASLEVANADITTFTNITHTTEATADTFATLTFTADGATTYLLDAQWYATRGTTYIGFALYMDGTDQGAILLNPTGAGTGGTMPFHWGKRVTPSAASHTFTLRAYVDAGTGTAGGGAGGAGVALGGYFRATKV